jgi:hypothetical protein
MTRCASGNRAAFSTTSGSQPWCSPGWSSPAAGAYARHPQLLFVLAVLANVGYCAAYLIDIPLQYSCFAERWRRWRWALWLAGMVFAAILACYFIANEIYPAV